MKVSAFLIGALLLVGVLGISGQNPLLECELEITSGEYAGLCTSNGQPTILQITPNVVGQVRVEVTSSEYFNTQICFMYGLRPTLDKSAFWKDGYCPSESFFSFKGNKSSTGSCPKTSSSSSKKAMLRAANQTLPLGSPSSQFFIPRTTDVAGGEATGYFIAGAISDKAFTGSGYACTASIRISVYSIEECPAGQIGQAGQACTTAKSTLHPGLAANPTISQVSVPAGGWSFFTFPFDSKLAPYFKLATEWASKVNTKTFIRWEGVPYVNQTKAGKVARAFDQKLQSTNQKQSLTFGNPRPGQYYIGFQNLDPANSISGSFNLTFLNRCSANYTYGVNCDIKATPLSKLKNNQGTVTSQKPTYILLDASSELLVSLSTEALSSPTMYLGAGFVPNSTYFSVEANTGQKVNRITTSTTGEELPWLVAVVAELQETIGFTIWEDTVCFNNCSGRGYCVGGSANDVVFNPTGECTCNKTSGKTTYENFACQTPNNHSFQLEYTILIAVGGAILLAIVIGVPIYCLVNKRKSQKSGYLPLP